MKQLSNNFKPKKLHDMDHQQAILLASKLGNLELLKYWNAIDSNQRYHLISQIKSIDTTILKQQKLMINESPIKKHICAPFTQYARAGNRHNIKIGKELIANGAVGCLIVAGGQGTRLGIEGPKGICPVTKIRKKSLFQLFAEKTLAASKQACKELPLAIMTSPFNHQETISFFENQAYFGLNKKQIFFFSQENLPLIDLKGNLFLEKEDTLAMGPDGNGGALHRFFDSGIWEKWFSSGVRYLNFILIDNPLADPYDAELIGYQKAEQCSVVIKCTERKKGEENVGIIVEENGKTAIVEYTEFPQDARSAIDSNGSLSYPLANLSLFSFSMEFIKETILKNPLPLHKALKKTKMVNNQAHSIHSEPLLAWKFERFIFDLLPFSSKTRALLYERETCFAPLKNSYGNDSIETVSKAIQKRDQEILSEITGTDYSEVDIEIAQTFYYPTAEILKKWKGQIGLKGYIDTISRD